MEEFYRPDFVDRINDMTFHGYDGGRESVAFYMTMFNDLRMGTEEQLTEGDRVASRWFLHGTYHGRPITLRGITISRFAEDGRIVEDQGHSDSIGLVRQLGVIRTLILGLEILTRRVKLPKGALGASQV
jgi:predicted ester cyclase